MTITLSWWMAIPASLITIAFILFYFGEKEAGGYAGLGGCFHGAAGLALLGLAAAFLLGRCVG